MAISTARGSAPRLAAIDIPIGTSSAVVAVLDMKLVSAHEMKKITTSNSAGEGSAPSRAMIDAATVAPAPVCSRALARASVPPKMKMVCVSMDS
ncbi:hypothetical protein D3C78_1237780 [compost metagenome]